MSELFISYVPDVAARQTAPAEPLSIGRRALLALPLIALLPRVAVAQSVALTPQDRADLARIEAYLNALHTLKAHFLQVAPDGTTSEGTAWMQRPGRMRFQYARPSPLLLVAGYGLFVFYDRELKQTTNIPLDSTPLGLLLRENLKLSGDVTVTGIERLPGQIQVSIVRTASRGDGSLTLVFADTPLALRQWVVMDAQRQETTVTLLNVELGGTFEQSMFAFPDPKIAPGGDRYYQ